MSFLKRLYQFLLPPAVYEWMFWLVYLLTKFGIFFFILAILVCLWWYCILGLSWIFLINKDEAFFICLLAVWVSFFMEYLVVFSAPFFIGLSSFSLSNCRSLKISIFWIQVCCWIYMYCKCISPPLELPFHSLNGLFGWIDVLNFSIS